MKMTNKSKFREVWYKPGKFFKKGAQDRFYKNEFDKTADYKGWSYAGGDVVTVSKRVGNRWKKLFTYNKGKLIKNKRRK